MLSPLAECPAPEILRPLEHEYSLKLELDPTWATGPIAIAHHWDRKPRSPWKIPVFTAVLKRAKQRSGAWSTPTLSGSLCGISKAKSSKPTELF
jgi:hypothetical protein